MSELWIDRVFNANARAKSQDLVKLADFLTVEQLQKTAHLEVVEPII